MGRSETGRRLLWAREQKRLTSRALAKLSGVSQGAISGLENGKHDAGTEIVEKLARALAVEPCWLAYGDQDKAPDWWIEGESDQERRDRIKAESAGLPQPLRKQRGGRRRATQGQNNSLEAKCSDAVRR